MNAVPAIDGYRGDRKSRTARINRSEVQTREPSKRLQRDSGPYEIARVVAALCSTLPCP
jgi:hypothetical protein